MKSITAQEILTVGSGIVGLSAEQAKTRSHNLKAIKVDKKGAGEYEVVNPIQFKRGETFAYSGEMSKTGDLRDPEAEALAKMELEDRIRAEVRAEEQAKSDKRLAAAETKLAEDFAGKLTDAVNQALAEQEARLRAEFAAANKQA